METHLEQALRAVAGHFSRHGVHVMGQASGASMEGASVASGATGPVGLAKQPHDPTLIVAALVVGAAIGFVAGKMSAKSGAKN